MSFAFWTSLALLPLSFNPAMAQYAIGASGQASQPGQPTNVAGNQQAVGMYNLGLTAYKQGSLESAVIFFRHATDLDPNLTDAQYNLGVLYQSERRLKEAVPRFQEVLRVKPSDPDAHYQLGIALMDLGRAAEAKAQFAAIAPASPHFADAQKRSQTCDQQLAGATVAQPSYSPNGQAPSYQGQQQTGMNLNPIAQDGLTAPSQYTLQLQQQAQPVQGQPAYLPPAASNGYGQQPPAQVTNPQTAAPNIFVPQAQAVPARPKNNGSPMAVLANSSVRVIATGFNAPAGLAFDRLGNLYVANFASNTIDRISADGTRMQFGAGTNIKGPIGLVCDDTGNVYVANYSGNTVARISPAGVSTVIGTGFRQPYYLTLDRDGNLFVSQQEDNTIVRITLPKTVVTRP
jgi:Tfp pilus assembly protein PilF